MRVAKKTIRANFGWANPIRVIGEEQLRTALNGLQNNVASGTFSAKEVTLAEHGKQQWLLISKQEI